MLSAWVKILILFYVYSSALLYSLILPSNSRHAKTTNTVGTSHSTFPYLIVPCSTLDSEVVPVRHHEGDPKTPSALRGKERGMISEDPRVRIHETSLRRSY